MSRHGKTGDRDVKVPDDTEIDPLSDDMTDAPSGARVIDRAIAFHLAGQLFGLPIDVVREIQQLAELLPLPDNDPALVGLIEIRGAVVPALDLRVLVGLEQVAYSLETPMVFCRAGSHEVCLIVDSVDDVVDLPSDGLQPPSAVYALADKMLGTVRLEQGVLMLLDIERLIPATALAITEVGEAGER